METCIIELNGEEISIPVSDLKWFVEVKGAKQKNKTTTTKKDKK
jgi:hypothetical protein